MAYLFKSLQQIMDIFDSKNELGATEISEIIGKSNVIVHKYLKELVKIGKLKKIGAGPRTKYAIIFDKNEEIKKKNNNTQDNTLNIGFSDKKLLDEIFLKFSAQGKILKGFDGIKKWCEERNLDPEIKIKSYFDIYNHILKLQDNCGLIDAKKAFGKDFEKVYLDEIYYADQYKRMDFGRGKLAEITFYGKQSQNKQLISQSIDEIIYKIECLVGKQKYDSIAIVPWSIDRKNQLLKMLKNRLKTLNLPFVNIIKYYPNGIAIPQKTLKTREQRLQNARDTIFVDDKNIENYNKILLIDDFVGSGSTLNETAKKLKQLGVKKIDGLAFVGNLNLSYDIISEI
ncbi:hypothetical protein M0P65_03600 [Candidatus Gracilibacteria bacterium]|nr:hypothetical protein [Candidatus Gracilibacteria bacterium]